MSRKDVIKWEATHDIETEGISTLNNKPESKTRGYTAEQRPQIYDVMIEYRQRIMNRECNINSVILRPINPNAALFPLDMLKISIR